MPDSVLFYLAAVSVVFWGSLFLLWWWSGNQNRSRIRALARARAGVSREHFIEHFRDREIPEVILAHVYAFFQGIMAAEVKNFPILPEDEIEKVYLLDMEDLEFEVIEWARKWKLKLPDAESEHVYPVKTVEDLVKFLSSCRRER